MPPRVAVVERSIDRASERATSQMHACVTYKEKYALVRVHGSDDVAAAHVRAAAASHRPTRRPCRSTPAPPCPPIAALHAAALAAADGRQRPCPRPPMPPVMHRLPGAAAALVRAGPTSPHAALADLVPPSSSSSMNSISLMPEATDAAPRPLDAGADAGLTTPACSPRGAPRSSARPSRPPTEASSPSAHGPSCPRSGPSGRS